MKKILTVLLIAVMAAGFVFAGVSGKAGIDFGYDLSSGVFGFKNDTELNFDFDFGTSATTANKGDVYAEATGSVDLYVLSDGVQKDLEAVMLRVDTAITGKVIGNNWSVAFSTSKFGPCDLAASAIDSYRDVKKNAMGDKVGFNWSAFSMDGVWDNKTEYSKLGVEANVFGYTLGLAFNGDTKETTYTNIKAYFLSKAFEIDGFSAQFGGSFASDNNVGAYYDDEADIRDAYKAGQVSAKLGYEADKFSGFVAGDFNFMKEESDDVETTFELAANATYDFVAFDAYYVNDADFDEYNKKGGKDNEIELYKYASAKLAFDFAKFDVPVTFAVTGKNLLALFDDTLAYAGGYLADPKKADFKFEVAYTGVIDANASFEVNGEGKYAVTFGAGYDAALFSVDATFTYDKLNDLRVMPTVVLSSDKLVSGAKLELGWYSNKNDDKFEVSGINNGYIRTDTEKEDKGWIGAKCTIAF